LTTEQVEQFKRDGYLRGGKVLDDDQVRVLQDEVGRVIDSFGGEGPQPVLCHNLSGQNNRPVWQIVNIWEASDPFHTLIHNQQIAQEMAQLTGASTLRIWHDQIQYKPAETGGVNMWHQDAPLWPILAPMTEVTAWVALDDVDEENGCMSMVPGSHRWGNQIAFLNTLRSFDEMPSSFEGHTVEVRRCPVRKGEVHFHHALVWHGSHANNSGRPRRAIALHYMTNETRYVASGDHVMKQFVSLSDGEMMQGDHFPVVWQG
ncbi:MAG: phytanoyl-CoA dioxygenase family protein, partial [Chloroflexi bacterium]|nr:phytanoyl-CoA dioxygenase family protein [Chloroflexota bacterium]